MKLIGIDTGVNTGFGVWDKDERVIVEIATLTITKAMDRVKEYAAEGGIYLYIEDARLRTWFGNSGREKLQGAGSVKRDAKIWEDFCIEQGMSAVTTCLMQVKWECRKDVSVCFLSHYVKI